MPRFNFGCTCGNIKSLIVKAGVTVAEEPCEECNGVLTKQFTPPQSLMIDVPDGYEYRDGKRAWRKRMTDSEYASVLLGEKEPY